MRPSLTDGSRPRGARPIHVSKITLAALDTRKHWLTIEWLPKYAPELNDIEVVWRDLKAHYLAHQTFTDAEALDREIHMAVEALNSERSVEFVGQLANFCLASSKEAVFCSSCSAHRS